MNYFDGVLVLRAAKIIFDRTFWLLFGGLPRWITSPGGLGQWSQTVRLSGQNILPSEVSRGALIDVELPRDQMLVKTISVPVAARKTLDKVVTLQIAQSSPNEGRDLIWRYKVSARDGDHLKVTAYLVKKSHLAEIAKAASKTGATLRTVFVEGLAFSEPLLDARSKTDRPKRIWVGACAALAMFSFGVLAYGWMQEYRGLNAGATELSQELDRRLLALQAAEAHRATQDEASSETRVKLDALAEDRQALSILVDLTQSLSDEVWVSDFSLREGDLRMSGFAKGDVPILLDELRALAWVKEASLDGPITFDSFRQQNRFDLRLKVAPFGEAQEL